MPKTTTPVRALKIIEKEKQEQTGVLDLINCGLKYIPNEVRSMTWLTVLGISKHSAWSRDKVEWTQKYFNAEESNNLREIPAWLSELKKLKHIGIAGQTLNSLDNLSHLVKLLSLSVDSDETQITNLSPLSKLKELSVLRLHTKTELDVSALSSLSKLKNLRT